MTASPFQRQTIALPAVAPGTSRSITVLRFGTPGAGPKAYIQASLHADEIPAMLVADHLARLLTEAAERGQIQGEILLVPYANPIGLGQTVYGELLGRYELGGDGNFNRGYPQIAEAVAGRVADRLGSDAAANVAAIKQAIRDELASRQPMGEAPVLKHLLFGMAADADIVLDLHCDSEALMHLYLGPALWPAARDLAAEIGSAATLLAEDSGGASFDEAAGGIWWALAKRFPDRPIPPACTAATVELRGQSDVDDATARQDATGLFRFLQRRGVVAGDPGPLPDLVAEASDLTATDYLLAPVGGVIAYHKGLGEQCKPGDLVCEIVHPGLSRTPVLARNEGVLITRQRTRYARPGAQLAKICGRKPLAHRQGYLLSD